MKGFYLLMAGVAFILGLQQLDIFLYNRQYDVNVLQAQYATELIDLRDYRQWRPNLTDGPPHNIFLATPIKQTW